MEGENGTTAYPPPYEAPANPVQQTPEVDYRTADAYYTKQQPGLQTNVVVVEQPVNPAVSKTPYSDPTVGSPGPMIFAIIVTVFAVCCCWWALLCGIPAIIFAANASSANAIGDREGAKSKRNTSLVLSIVTLVAGIAGLVIIFGLAFGLAFGSSSARFGFPSSFPYGKR